MSPRLSQSLFATAAIATIITAGYALQQNSAQKPEAKAPQRPTQAPHGFPDLLTAIKNSPGCLGVEVARTPQGMDLVFSWFEDKAAVKKWYYSETHMQAMEMFFQERAADFKPLDSVPEDAGPLLVIASITPADDAHFKETNLPISQIAIEIYEPVTGGLFLGRRFAPDKVHVEGMQDYTPPKKDAE